MKKDQMKEIEALIMEEVVRRRKLGGYNADATSILLLSEIILRVVGHLIDQYPTPKAKAKK